MGVSRENQGDIHSFEEKTGISYSHPHIPIVQSTTVRIQNTGGVRERERSDSKKRPWMSRNFDNLRRSFATCKTISDGTGPALKPRQSQRTPCCIDILPCLKVSGA